MVALLCLGREFGYAKLETAVAQAMELGCTDVAAIRHLLMSDELQHAAATTRHRSTGCLRTSAADDGRV